MQVPGRVRREAREAHVNAHNQVLAGVKVCDLHDAVQVLRAGSEGSVKALAHQRRGLGPVKADVAIVPTTLSREVHAAHAHVQDVGVANAMLAVVFRVEVVRDEDSLVVISTFVNDDLREEDDPIAAGKVLRF